MELFNSPYGTFQINRLPIRAKETYRGWDAADELLLNHLHNQKVLSENAKILIVNDAFAALSCCLHEYQICSWSDSYLSHLAAEHNYRLNNITNKPVLLASTQSPVNHYQVVLIKIPKTLSLLEHQLITLKHSINQNSTVIVAGMVKYIEKSHFRLLEKYLGTTTTSYARKKARLLFPALEKLTIDTGKSPFPIKYLHPELGIDLSNHANVFSKNRLDIGSRFMIEHLRELPESETIIDLGCGNGILGITAKIIQQLNFSMQSTVHFSDESYMAVDSAKTNCDSAFYKEPKLMANNFFHISDCLSQVDINKVDLIVCNPPFHQNNTVSEHLAMAMFRQSQKKINQGGELWIVANRHLSYEKVLKKLFFHVRILASNSKFFIIVCTQR